MRMMLMYGEPTRVPVHNRKIMWCNPMTENVENIKSPRNHERR